MTETPALYGPTQATAHTPGPYVVRNGSEVWKQPHAKRHPDGASTTYALGFKVCDGVPEYIEAVDASGVGFRGAYAIAELLNRGQHFDELLGALESLENDANQIPAWLWKVIQDVIRGAKGGTHAGDQ